MPALSTARLEEQDGYSESHPVLLTPSSHRVANGPTSMVQGPHLPFSPDDQAENQPAIEGESIKQTQHLEREAPGQAGCHTVLKSLV